MLQVRPAQWSGWKLNIHRSCLAGLVFRQIFELMRLTLRHKGSSRELIKRWELVFTAEVKSYISFRQPSDSHGGARSFSNTKLDKRVLKESNKRLLKNAEINKSDFKVFFSSSKRNSGLVSTQKGDAHLVQHIFAYALMRSLQPSTCWFALCFSLWSSIAKEDKKLSFWGIPTWTFWSMYTDWTQF